MSFSCTGSFAERNAKLLIKLMKEHHAKDLGSVCGFFEVSEEWCCPSCHRTKAEIARIDKNGNLMCALHNHHDHLNHVAQDKLPPAREIKWDERRGYDSLVATFARFPDTLICNDCNVVEGLAKREAGTPPDFSFTPFEISTFIIVCSNAPHKLDIDKARVAWANINPSLDNYRDKLRQIMNYDSSDPDSFDHIGGAAWRVLKDVRKKMKKQDQ